MDEARLKRGTRIRSLRKGADMTQQALAGKLDLKYQSVQEWELGKTSPSADNIGKLSNLFKIHPTWLWIGQGPKHIKKRR